jgi:Ras-related GTP-binding protein A/B
MIVSIIENDSMSHSFKIKSFATSIWDETLYKAWSNIVYSMIPNVDQLESQLKEFCDICGADEVVLFEKATFLEISHTTALRYAFFCFSLIYICMLAA